MTPADPGVTTKSSSQPSGGWGGSGVGGLIGLPVSWMYAKLWPLHEWTKPVPAQP
ncbi:MAG: hypothetical protein WAS21_18990 [Geminicoccaceae bacterium]